MIAPRHSKLKLEPEREHELKQRRCLKCRKLFMSDWLATDVVGCSRLMVNAGVILVTSSPAFAHHDTVGGGAATGGSTLIGAVLPIVVGVVAVMVGVGIWGRKKRKTKSKRRKRRN